MEKIQVNEEKNPSGERSESPANRAGQAFTYYTVASNHGLIELRQTRFASKYNRGIDHPHDVCAYAHNNDEMRDMVRECKLGTVDYSRTENANA